MNVAAARADRHALYTLSNDHRAVTEELHTALGQLHAQRRAQGGSGARGSAEAGAAAPSALGPSPAAAAPAPAPAPAPRSAPLANGQPASAPFAVVDSVAAGSPAGAAGVRVRALPLSLRLSTGAVAVCYLVCENPLCYRPDMVCGDAQAGDQVLSFGAVAGGGGNALRQVAQLVQARAPTPLPWPPAGHRAGA